MRERQEQAQKEAERKKEIELEQQRLEKEALVRTHTEGMLVVLKDARAQLPDITLRVPLVDSVGFPTSISHLKSRLRADYFGEPPEHRQVPPSCHPTPLPLAHFHWYADLDILPHIHDTCLLSLAMPYHLSPTHGRASLYPSASYANPKQ